MSAKKVRGLIAWRESPVLRCRMLTGNFATFASFACTLVCAGVRAGVRWGAERGRDGQTFAICALADVLERTDRRAGRGHRPRHHLQLRGHLAAGALRDHRQRPG